MIRGRSSASPQTGARAAVSRASTSPGPPPPAPAAAAAPRRCSAASANQSGPPASGSAPAGRGPPLRGSGRKRLMPGRRPRAAARPAPAARRSRRRPPACAQARVRPAAVALGVQQERHAGRLGGRGVDLAVADEDHRPRGKLVRGVAQHPRIGLHHVEAVAVGQRRDRRHQPERRAGSPPPAGSASACRPRARGRRPPAPRAPPARPETPPSRSPGRRCRSPGTGRDAARCPRPGRRRYGRAPARPAPRTPCPTKPRVVASSSGARPSSASSALAAAVSDGADSTSVPSRSKTIRAISGPRRGGGPHAAFHLIEQPIAGICSRGPCPVSATCRIAS